MANLTIPVTKAKATLTIDTDVVPDAYYQEALAQGFKALINGGATKITKETYPDEEELKAKALETARARVQAMYEGKLKLGRSAKSDSTKVPGEVMTEARRLARDLVKQALKDAGHRISHYSSTEITIQANAVIAANPEIIEQAAANIEARKTKKPVIDIAAIKEDPAKVGAANAKKAAAKAGPLSAKQAAKVAPRVTH